MKIIIRAAILLATISVLFTSCKKTGQQQPMPEVLTGSWKRVAVFGGSWRSAPFAFTIGNKGYILGGLNDTGSLNDFWEYDPSTDKWTRKADYPGNDYNDKAGFEINNKGYVCSSLYALVGSAYLPTTKEFYEYDPSLNKWTRKADFAAQAREYAIAFSINGMGYFGLGGINDGYDSQAFTDFWRYDATADKWTQMANYPGALASAIGFACNGKGYVGLGIDNNELWEYNPSLDQWVAKANLIGGNRYNTGQFVIGTNAYIGIGGGTRPQSIGNSWIYPYLKDVREYNTQTDSWAKKADFPGQGRNYPACFSINGIGYAGLGSAIDPSLNGARYLEFYEFIP